MMGARGAAVVLLGALLAARGSHAAVLCRAGSGKLALREQCRKAEQALDPNQLDLSALAGPPGGPGGAGPRGPHPLRIVASAGTEIGPIQFFTEGGATVAITHPALTATVFFLLNSTGFNRNTAGAISTVYYAAADCAGVPYLRVFSEEVPFAQVYGSAAYYETGPAASRSTVSAERDPGDSSCAPGTATPRGTCCFALAETNTLAPAVRVPLADLGFVPPFQAVPR